MFEKEILQQFINLQITQAFFQMELVQVKPS